MFKRLALVAAVAALVGCDGNDEVTVVNPTQTTTVTEIVTETVTATAPLSMTIAHINDHHSHLGETGGFDALSLQVTADKELDFSYGGFPRVVSKIKDIKNANDNVLKLHAGDAITGDLYYILYEGTADAQMMDLVCFDAFALGNHEFDEGDAGLAKFLDELAMGCGTPVLAANVVPGDTSPLKDGYLEPYTIKSVGGQQVGIIGIDIAQKTKNSSNPDEGTEFLDELETAQLYIDELTEMDVNKIILLTHYQYANDLDLAQGLTGVDVIVGGDSHSLLGEGFADEAIGLSPEGDYPTMETNLDGDPVCIVQAWQYSAIVGELHVDFDKDGVITNCEGTPHLLLSDEDVAAEDMQDVMTFVQAHDVLSLVKPDPVAQSMLAGYDEEVDELFSEVIGTSSEDLCQGRKPGQVRTALCPNEEDYLPSGGAVPQIVAEAFRTQVKDLDGEIPDLAIQNGGGVRDDLPEGDITLGGAYDVLPFGNTMVILTMSGQEVVDSIEDAIDYAYSPEGSSGAYPYASYLRWDLDMTKEKGQRLSNVEVKTSGEWAAIDLTAEFTVVTNNFIAAGRDGYITFGEVSADGRIFDTKTRYVQPLLDYIEEVSVVSRPAASEFSTQSYIAPAE
ncbi:MAG: 5'-nucleotidase C-terminal domain-containing protein [Pseudomonadota bacterium]|nr:5'-nucleotidase C-terminal domain-containing protein [Pseudomonadota bacterium]